MRREVLSVCRDLHMPRVATKERLPKLLLEFLHGASDNLWRNTDARGRFSEGRRARSSRKYSQKFKTIMYGFRGPNNSRLTNCECLIISFTRVFSYPKLLKSSRGGEWECRQATPTRERFSVKKGLRSSR